MTDTQPTDPDELLRQAAWVRRLARSLLFDPNEADDAAQQTWLAALTGDGRTRRDQRAWLAGVLRNVVRRQYRSDERRRRREGIAARPESMSGTADLVAQAELHRRVVMAVLDLEEPYRTTVLKRYFQDVSAEAIAREEAVPGATVRSRLKRALDMLRRRLDGEFGGDRRAWSLALAPLALAGSGARPVVATGSAASITSGVLIMSAKAKLAACSILALLAVGTVWTATQAESEAKRDESVGLLESLDEPIRAVDGVPEPRVGDVTRLAAGGSDSLVSTDEVHASAAPVEPGPGTLLVRVVDSGSRPIANALVFLKSNVTETVPTDADGLATFAVPPGTEVAACARHVDYRFDTANVTTSDDAATPTDLTIVLEKHLTACVRVESKDGAPIEGATVEFRELETQGVGLLGLSVQGPALRERSIAREYFKGQFQEARTSERDGTCCVAGLMPGPLAVSAEADGFVRVASLPFDVGEEGGDLGIVRLEAAREVPGIVLDDAGPVPDALVESHVSAHAYVHTRTDADGRFVLQGVQPDLMHLVLRVSHESRGDYYNASEPITASGLTVLLRPTLHATLRLFDASTRQPVDKPCFVTPLMPRNELSIYVVLQVAGRRELSPVSGEVRVDDVHYFGLGLRVEVPGYSRVDVDTATIAEAAGEPIDLYVQWQGNISVRALDALTGKAVSGAKVIVANVVAGAHGPLNSWRTIAADYDDAAGAYVVDASVFNMLSGQDEALVIAADGYAWSAQLPVIRNGVRVAGPSMEIQLDRE